MKFPTLLVACIVVSMGLVACKSAANVTSPSSTGTANQSAK